MRPLIAGLVLLAGSPLASTLMDATRSDAAGIRAPFLLRGMAARPVGMGEAFTAVSDDASAVSWNPGGLAQLRAPSAVVMYDAAGADLSVSYLAGAAPVGPLVAGAGVTMVGLGSYIKRTEDGTKIGEESLSDMAVTAAVALRHGLLGGTGGSGVAVELVRDGASQDTLIGLSAGTLVRLGEKTRVGAAVQHLGPAKDGFSLPATVRVGASRDLLARLSLAADAGYGLSSAQAFAAGGVEVRPYEVLTIRAGYKWISESAGFSGMPGLTAGLGVNLKGFSLDYAYQPFGDFATSHRIALTWTGK